MNSIKRSLILEEREIRVRLGNVRLGYTDVLSEGQLDTRLGELNQQIKDSLTPEEFEGWVKYYQDKKKRIQ